MYEVEQKFRVSGFTAIETSLRQLGATIGPTLAQSDVYFAHPSRDFAVTDEALRIRRVGDANFITYKGKRIDSTTKTRREIDLSLPDGEQFSAHFSDLLRSLGFSPVAEVRKHRRKAEVLWDNQSVEVSLDDVEDVGDFIELELIADDQTIDMARNCLASLAAKLGLSDNERRSYLELLLNERSARTASD